MIENPNQQKVIISSTIFMILVFGLIVSAIVWASFAKLDEITRGAGRVIPSSQVQIIQNLEGGILSELKVNEGDIVQKGDILLRIDDTGFSSTFRENQARRDSMIAKIRRLTAEVLQKNTVDFSGINDKSVIEAEKALFNARKTKFLSTVAVLQKQVKQREQEIKELKRRVKNIKHSLSLAEEEQNILKPMVKKGVTSRIELIRSERQTAELVQALDGAELSIPRATSSLEEAKRRIEEHKAIFVSKGREELTQVQLRLTIIEEALSTVEDRVRRTEVRSPVFGTVQRVLIKTLGGVIQPGMNLVEIVPLDDSLLIEAKVRPSDVAFLKPGLPVKVRLSAYDFSTYGTLKGSLKTISADAIIDEYGESFFQVTVRTDKNYLENNNQKLPIIPGMIADIDILTGHRSVLEYFLDPIKRIREHAFREP